ncbi:MAG TPA: DUF3604 domain-containing protein [Blastocatellia bacterium]|nr:DUF3604 domain-containing protein [Blastocatellia bacterium]
MRSFFIAMLCLAAIGGGFFFAMTNRAQTVSLTERVNRLRAEINNETTADNYRERIQTLFDWADELGARGNYLPQPVRQVLTTTYVAGFTPNTHRVVAQWTKTLGFIEDNSGKMGTFARTDGGELVAGEYATLTFEYTVGDVTLNTGAILRMGQHFMTDSGRPQIARPQDEAFVTFRTSNANVKVEAMTSPWLSAYAGFREAAPMPAAKIVAGKLGKGDKLIITLGDKSQGGRGYQVQTRDANGLRYPLEADLDGSGLFVPVGVAEVNVKGHRPAGINAIAPSIVGVNESFALRLRVEDQFRNPTSILAAHAGGAFKVKLNGRELGRINVAAGEKTGQLNGVKLDRAGAYRFEVSSEDGQLNCVSNPVLVEANPQQRIYWGELHGHSGWEEGVGTPRRYYEHARDTAFLDFASLTGHDTFLIKSGWEDIRRETAAANRAGQFVAYMGYEWSATTDRGGHHNVFFKTDNGRYATQLEAPRLPLLYEKLRAIESTGNLLVIPHAHQTGDWNYSDGEIERLVEIYSMHGRFEYFGQRFLRRGYRVGLIAASDDHTGHPGYAPAYTASRGGLAAVYAPRLNRDTIWDGMKQRATYATTSAQRIVVKMSAGANQVGQSVKAGAMPVLNARVLGTAAIDHIDVIHNGQVEYSRNYLQPENGKPSAVQIMFHSPTETPGDNVTFPQNGVTWRGWIEVTGGRIGSIEKLSTEHRSDQFNQVNDQRLWFHVKTRGDLDGLLLKLAQAPNDARVTVRIAQVDRDPGPQGSMMQRAVLITQPGATALHEYSFKVNDVAAQQGSFEVPKFGFIYARKINAAGRWDAAFSYRPTKAPAQDDYFYLRVVQVDGEAAWGFARVDW